MSALPPPLAAEAHGHLDLSTLTPLEWAVLAFTALAALWSIWRAVRLTLSPGEREPDHIKRIVLVDPVRIETTAVAAASGAGSAADAGGAQERSVR